MITFSHEEIAVLADLVGDILCKMPFEKQTLRILRHNILFNIQYHTECLGSCNGQIGDYWDKAKAIIESKFCKSRSEKTSAEEITDPETVSELKNKLAITERELQTAKADLDSWKSLAEGRALQIFADQELVAHYGTVNKSLKAEISEVEEKWFRAVGTLMAGIKALETEVRQKNELLADSEVRQSKMVESIKVVTAHLDSLTYPGLGDD